MMSKSKECLFKAIINQVLLLLLTSTILTSMSCNSDPTMPLNGICAHRGARNTHPENTIAAFREAIRLGAHMIECDVQLSKDKKMVIMHDATVDRTTNGTGNVSELSLHELKALDAGSWKDPVFKEETIPTLQDVLAIMPRNVWLNLHLKNNAALGEMVTKLLVEQKRLHQSFLACNKETARSAKTVNKNVKICNMDRTDNTRKYVDETVEMNADFIQLKRRSYKILAETIKKLKKHGIRINYFGTNSAETLQMLFNYGVEFPLVDDLEPMMNAARDLGIEPVMPLY